jgi:pimeloyl-ACP methyl ester carboxylesterase
MATFVLVHGAWAGADCYGPVAKRLREAGYTVFTPTLTGLGERAHLASPAITLSTHVRDVAGMLEYKDLHDVVLAGHSYGGMVITGAAALCAERIRTLFYFDAFLPKDGESLWDIVDESTRALYIKAQRESPGLIAPIFRPRPGARPLPVRQLGPQPLLTFLEPVRLSGHEKAIKNRTYVYAEGPRPSVFTRFYEAVKADPAWTVHTVTSGHMAMLDDPETFTALLREELER